MTAADPDRPTPVKLPVTSLELILDPGLETAVRAEWEALRAAGMSSMAAHPGPSNRPHVTVLARRWVGPVDPTRFAGLLPVPVTLGAPLLFGSGDRRVLARSVVPNRELLALHGRVHDLVGSGDDLPHTTPGRWTAHVTLARRLKIDQLADALPLVGGLLDGQCVGLRRWDSAERLTTTLAGEPTGPR